jgi:AmmeMemoRadiSam system protein A
MALSPSTSAAEASSRGRLLIAIAREAIEQGPAPLEAPLFAEPWLAQPGASFVTLKLDGELRGCIGSLEPRRGLAEDVAQNARAAAYRDPRFPPVGRDERRRLEIEISLLSAPQPIAARTEQEAAGQLRPGIDGVVLEFGELRSTFLPQVWESLPDPADFLGELKRKAGLPRDFWDPAIRLARYTVEKYR